MSNSTRWHASRRFVAAAATAEDIYVPAAAGDSLNVRQLRVGTSAAAELVVYWSQTTATPAAASAIPQGDIVFGHVFAANGGMDVALSCLGAWPDKAGSRLRVYTSAPGTVYAAAEGTTE